MPQQALDLDLGDTSDFTTSEAVAAITRITSGNFRLTCRLVAQIQRVLEITGIGLWKYERRRPARPRVSAADLDCAEPGGGIGLAARNAVQGHRVRGPIAALASAGATTFGPGMPGLSGPRRPSSAPFSLAIICEVIEGAGPHQPPGNRSRDGKAERPGS